MAINPDRSDSDWVGRRLREALSSALAVRLHGTGGVATEQDLRRACRALGARAVERGRDAEHVVRVFRELWDQRFERAHGDDPRSLLYYGTLSLCLDAYEERARVPPMHGGAETSAGTPH